MTTQVPSTANPVTKNIGPVGGREPQKAVKLNVPEGSTIVSADGHWEICEDIFYEGFPSHLRDRAPRVWFDKYWHVGYRGGVEALGVGARTAQLLSRSVDRNGMWDIDLRLGDMNVEGVEKELVYPQSLIGFARYNDMEVQEHVYRVYNEYVAKRSAESSGRLFGVGVFSNWWNPERAEAAMSQIVDLGLKTFLIPITPGKYSNGRSISYGDPEMERLWSVIEAAGLPVSFHVGENPEFEPRGGVGTSALTVLGGFRRPFAQLLFGGVFDRNPKLRVVFAEGGLSWVLPALQDAEATYDAYGSGDCLDPINHRPTYYWHEHCYATFQNDPLGMSQLDAIGPDRVMWASDYPHSEGTFGYTSSSMQAVVAATTAQIAQKILGGTAIEVYGLD